MIHKTLFQNKWFHFLLTLTKSEELKVYINGVFVLKGVLYQEVETPNNDNSGLDELTIAGPYKLVHVLESGHFDIGHLAMWTRSLANAEIVKAFKTSVRTDEKSKDCCQRKASEHLCFFKKCHYGKNHVP